MKLDGEKLLADLYLEREKMLTTANLNKKTSADKSLECLDRALALGDIILRIEQGDYTIKDKG